ncbi:sporulation histidine kinase inhibitor Sda [Peribacillus glennii]|uniref:Sporulation histidine kinase inhibitor Sda n=1 Tax=Peribacillus glennii TaxID=2303991 RepID=A0A372LG43_9BACI|nr:sporulation histidine kinase inhibitor Sda [Peribacillus glennii]RFU65271.1 sporulation histidine kinase inhibitor Sda [Peribacillus glennii]
MKIMSNELLVVSYRDAVSSNKDQDLIKYLKDEIQRRGLRPFKNK